MTGEPFHPAEEHKPWILVTVLVCASLLAAESATAADATHLSFGRSVGHDYANFYSNDRLARVAFGIMVSGIAANSSIDETVQEWYQNDFRKHSADTYSDAAKTLGEGKYLIPLTLLAGSASHFDSDSAVGAWGLNALRAYVVGGPVTLLAQGATGSSRPGESSRGSAWQPFNDSNGVSGHAFMGAVPFLTLARMSGHNRVLRTASYAASTVAAWSRVNDHSHYLSQAALGWYLAHESVASVFDTNNQVKRVSVMPVIGPQTYGVYISAKW